jgi:accessory colonization factor AcfC
MKKYILMFIATISNLLPFAQTDTLHVYGTGGPFSAMKEYE